MFTCINFFIKHKIAKLPWPRFSAHINANTLESKLILADEYFFYAI